jgi:tripartite-type tricarboxylate transporter receptor subunit TctC
MRKIINTTIRLLCAATALSLAAPVAWSASHAWPSKPLRMIVPFPPGGAADATARLVAESLRVEFSQPVVVDNRPGASGNIGTEHAAKAPSDGYTVLMANSSIVTNISLYKKLPYDFVRDFSPVSRIAFVPNVLVVNPNLIKIDNLPAFIKFVKDHKGKPLNYGSGGSGTSLHLAGALFGSMLKADLVHVPYKGGAAAATGLLGGEVQLVFSPLAEIVGHLDAGRMRPLGVTTSKRSGRLPDVPALNELLPGFDVALWTGILVPAGTPERVVKRLNDTIVKSLNAPELRKRLFEQGADASSTSPAEFRKFIAFEIEKWGKLVKISGAQVQ